MIIKQKIAVITALILFLISAGTIESNLLVSMISLFGFVTAVMIGGLDKKRTSIEGIEKELK